MLKKLSWLGVMLLASSFGLQSGCAQVTSGFGYSTGEQYQFNQPFGAPGAINRRWVYPNGSVYYPGYQAGFGYYGPYQAACPIFGVPQPLGGSGFSITSGSTQFRFWKSPSGYYYPWLNQTYYGYVPPVIIYEQGTSTVAQPPLSTVFSDLTKFLEESKEKGRLTDADYRHLWQRLKDLMGKEASQKNANGGTLEAADEQNLRKDLDLLGAEIARLVKP